MPRYTRNGAQVLLHNEPFAQGVDEIAAMMVLNALRAVDEQHSAKPHQQWSDGGVVEQHQYRREGDERTCSCGLRWGTDEPDPHGEK